MSRQSPVGFVFSMVVEIAAIALIVSLLPRVDLRPAAAAPNVASDPAISHVGWTMSEPAPSKQAARETSYYERRAAQVAPISQPALTLPRREPPPLIEVDPARPGYVEQRLDRASQQLVNSVGSAVAQAAGDWLPNPPVSQPNAGQPSGAFTPALQAIKPLPPPPAPAYSRSPGPNPRAIARDPHSGSFQTQPRPWIRY
jgi:hypothetical protein